MMVKNCCVIGCYNKYSKGSGISFYRFPTDPEKRSKWISAVKRKDWEPNKYTWLCSEHFISGKKINDPLSPDYVPSVFSFVRSPLKHKGQQQLDNYERRRKARIHQTCVGQVRLLCNSMYFLVALYLFLIVRS